MAFERAIAVDEIDLDTGFLIMPASLPQEPASPPIGVDEHEPSADQTGRHGGVAEGAETFNPTSPKPAGSTELTLSFTANKEQIYGAWNALANLADIAGNISIHAKATPPAEHDNAKLENGVLEPLRELGLIEDGQGQE